ncbi:ATP-binding protein [Streptomyces sp. NPDC047108]|uniref:ATP-binding protein n=1 Tax=Streptomyces sp. NPDC047108 TaxID=3155025 RepID=UPI0033EB3284
MSATLTHPGPDLACRCCTIPVSEDLRAPAAARRAAGAFLDSIGPGLTHAARDDALLVVSELVTNAVRHAGGPRTLRLTASPGALEAAVTDGSPAPPVPREPDLVDGTGGLGWPLLECLTTSLYATPEADGKTTHATLAFTRTEEAERAVAEGS